jgi:hypothetical protein
MGRCGLDSSVGGALVNTVMNIGLPQNVDNFLTDYDKVLKQDCSTELVS